MMVTKLLLLPVNSYVTSFIIVKMNVCFCLSVRVSLCACFACLPACVGIPKGWVKRTWMSLRYQNVSVQLFSKSFPFMPSAWITLCIALCQVDSGESRDQLPSKLAIIIIREAAALLPLRLFPSLQRQKENRALLSRKCLFMPQIFCQRTWKNPYYRSWQ